MDTQWRIVLDENEWSLLSANLLTPSDEYSVALIDRNNQINQNIEIEETDQFTIIRSSQIDYDGLFAILDGESVEKQSIETVFDGVKIRNEWMSNVAVVKYTNTPNYSKKASFFSGSDNNLAAA